MGYVQMGELAYHIAEQSNGERTVDQIARAVSEALGRPVGVGDVRALIHTVLVPRGVVTVAGEGDPVDDVPAPGDDGPAPDVGVMPDPAPRPARAQRRGGAAGERARGVGGPAWVVGATRLEAVAAILMWLFWPPVVLVLVGCSAATLTWLFFVHGLAAGVMELLALPVLLPVALLLALLAIPLQALGPMVALYGAGARIERLRITPSLPRPSIGLDVTDDYGLSRWARLTVDAGGVYLQVVASLLLGVAGMLTGTEFLFVSATLLVLNGLRLLLPFGRPGADRMLADLLLVPEPLRYAEHALDRLLPRDRASALPPLKRWGRITIWAYLLVTVLVLAVVGLAVLRAAPIIVATTLMALVIHLADMTEALGARDVAGALGGLFQAVVLAVTSFVLAVAVVAGACKLVMALAAWGRSSPRGRLITTAGAALTAVLLVLFWVPIPRFGVTAGGAPPALLGTAFRPLSPISRGAIPDLFLGTAVVEEAAAPAGVTPSVTTDVGTGLGAPAPSPGPR